MRILIVPGMQMMIDPLKERRGGLIIGKALRQIDRATLFSQAGHHREDGGADPWELAFELRHRRLPDRDGG